MKATAHRRIGRRFVACLAAIAMALAGSIVVAATVAPTASAASAWESLSLTEKQSSYGFFMYEAEHGTSSLQKSSAQSAADYLKTAKFASQYTRIGQQGDATDLGNFLIAAKLLVNFNGYRSTLPNEPCRHDLSSSNTGYVQDCTATSLTPLRASYQGFSEAQANVNYSAYIQGHAHQGGQSSSFWSWWAENIGWGTTVPANFDYTSFASHGSMELWYDEINIYDKDATGASGTIGHYTNMTNKITNSSTNKYVEFTSSGYAYNTYSSATMNQRYRCTDGVDFYRGDQGYTVDAQTFVSQIESYISLVKTIGSVTAPAGITVESGTDPKASAPSTVSVTYSDGTTGTANVTWDGSNTTWKNRKGGSYTMSGTVHDSVANKDLSTSIAVTVKPAGIKVANTSSSTNLTVDPGTDLSTVLPTLTSITYTNGETVPGGTLKWSIPDGATNGQHLKSTDFSVPGEVYDADGVDTKQTVNANITVRPITVSTVNAVTASTTSGIAPSLPSTVTVNWSYGDPSTESVTWDSIPASSYAKAGTFTVNGIVNLGSGTTTKATATVTVQDAIPASAVFDGTSSPSTSLTIDAGTDPTSLLKARTATVTYTDSTGATIRTDTGKAVTWDAVKRADYMGSTTADTQFTVKGTVDGLPVTATVTVRRATPSNAVIKGSDSAQAAVTTAAGTAPALPGTATVTYSNGDTRDTQITWDAIPESSYHGSIDENTTFQANGTVDGTSLTVSAAVTVTPPTATKVAFDDGTTKSAVSTPAGIKPGLPGTATVTYSNGDTRAADITWGDVAASQYAKAGAEFDVTGHVAALPGTALTAHVTVTDAYLVGVTFHGTDSTTTTATTPAGTRPSLPETADATYSDGTVVPVTIQWDATPDSSYHGSADADQTVTVTGHASGTDLTATVTVQRATPTSAVIDGTTSATAAVSTDAGVAPSLPATATVTYSNGDTANAAIKWDDVDASAYAGVIGQTTTFTVNGTADGMPVSATVTVSAKPATQNMYRLYNPNSGEHFFTGDMNEYKTLCDLGWRGEDVSWVAPTQGDAVYRLYNPNTGEHHYTLDTNERDTLIGQYGWKGEGIGWYSGGSTPVYRVYNPNAFQFGHLFTADDNERTQLLGYGWNDEAIGWYAVSAK